MKNEKCDEFELGKNDLRFSVIEGSEQKTYGKLTIDSLIVSHLKGEKIGKKPSQIAKELDLKPSSVRSRCSALYKNGLLDRREGGYYYIKDDLDLNYGVKLRIQNVRLFCNAVVDSSDSFEEEYGLNKIQVQYGKSRDKISATLSSPEGIDYPNWCLVFELLNRICTERGYVDLIWTVNSFEPLFDYKTYNLEGIGTLTIDHFTGLMEKLYKKEQ